MRMRHGIARVEESGPRELMAGSMRSKGQEAQGMDERCHQQAFCCLRLT